MNEEDLERIVKAGEKENVSIDYKASEALNFDDKKQLKTGDHTLGAKHREELIRDVTALANAEGGRIIYGIKERTGGYPKCVDDGYDAGKTNADRIEQILITNIHPRIEGFSIMPVELKSKGRGSYAFVITIPKASAHAPHQADDKLYYKRHEATRMAMEDYEIRDMMRRSIEYGKRYAAAWDLAVEVRRLGTTAAARDGLGAHFMTRDQLRIAVSQDLRSAGIALVQLAKPLRSEVSELVIAIDEYNSIVETIDPGHQQLARISDRPRSKLHEIRSLCQTISAALQTILDREP
jgi:hypothetical protein